MNKTIILFIIFEILIIHNQAQTVTDYDGNIYNTVSIGTQIWLKENLKVTHYQNGDTIPIVIDSIQWKNLQIGAYCNYNNIDSNYVTYGRYYNWYAVTDNRKIAPVGWHVATDGEWTILINYLGGEYVAGGKLKETGTIHWEYPNVGATNQSLFTALPGGWRSSTDGSFGYIGFYGDLWTSTESSTSNAWLCSLYYNDESIIKGGENKKQGLPVRCIKDASAPINELDKQEKIDIYPNPAHDIITIHGRSKQIIKVQVFNLVGQCVLQENLINETNMVDINSLERGIYILHLISTNWTLEKKIIKE
jgi:uncharacterized protein (TIGR02145 family)